MQKFKRKFEGKIKQDDMKMVTQLRRVEHKGGGRMDGRLFTDVVN